MAVRSESVSDVDPLLAELAEQITAKLEAGESIDPDDFREVDPTRAGEIAGLVAALRDLAQVGRSSAVSSPAPPGLDPAPAPDSGPAVLPFELGDFRLLREVGRGGMGVVYEAEQVSLARRVAVKVLPLAATLDPRAFQRFQLEAQAAALLSHPNIVPIHSIGVAGGVPYYAMQFIEGSNLAEVVEELARVEGRSTAEAEEAPDAESSSGAGTASTLAASLLSGRYAPSRRRDGSASTRVDDPSADRPAPTGGGLRTSRRFVRTVAWLGVQAARALQHAHEQGVIHRDIKPANLMFDPDGHLWVTDFGLAVVPLLGSAHTRSGDAPGTLRYMSPEQAQGGPTPVDHHTDVYSLGVTLYELLALRPAVPGRHRGELLRRLAHEEPAPLRGLNPAVPADLATILAKATARDPATRYASAAALADDLERFLDGRPIAARPVGPLSRLALWCRSNPAIAALAAGLILALSAGLAVSSWGWSEAVRQRDLLAQATRQLGRERDQKERERAATAQALELAEAAWGQSERDRAGAESARLRAESARADAARSGAVADAVNRFLVQKILLQAQPESNPVSKKITLLEVLDRASAEVGTAFPGQPSVEAMIRVVLAQSFHALGDFARSEGHLRAALDLGESAFPSPIHYLGTKVDLAHALDHQGRPAETLPLLRAAYEATAGATDEARRFIHAKACLYLGDQASEANDPAAAERAYREYLELVRVLGRPEPDRVQIALNRLGHALQLQGKFEDSLTAYEESIELSTRLSGPRSVATLSAENNRATLLQLRGAYGAAREVFRRILPWTEANMGPLHPATLSVTFNLGFVSLMLGDLEEAEALLRWAHEALGPSAPLGQRLEARLFLAEALRQLGRRAEAEGLVRRTLDEHAAALPRGVPLAVALDAFLRDDGTAAIPLPSLVPAAR